MAATAIGDSVVGDAPSAPVRSMFAPVLPESATVTLATVPSPIVFALIPDATQKYPLMLLAQFRVLPAASRAGPAATLRLEIAAVG